MRPGLQTTVVQVGVLLGLLLTGPTRAIDVVVDYDPEVDFSDFKTLGWMAGTPADDPEVEKKIRVAVERELVGAGYKEVREEPDILVVTHASIDSERLIDLHDYDYWQSFVGRRPPATAEEIWGSETGAILVDILDPESERLIWRGVATGVVGKNPEKRDFKINQVVGKMFKGFPPKWRADESGAQKSD